MTIKSILSELENANHPIIKILHKGTNFKVLFLGFKKGMMLKEHTTNINAKLIVIKGSVLYKEKGKAISLAQFEEHDISIGEPHSVEAIEEAICLLIQG